MAFNAIDLFSGAGGLHIGFEKAGFDIELCIDNNDLVERTHRRNFPNIPMINRDIKNVSSDEIRTYLKNGEVDVIIGGPPCQGFSTIGKRVSSDPEKRAKHDPRNELVLTYAKLIRELRPKFILMENVKGILTLQDGAYLANVIKQLRDAGYEVAYKLINMADYGVPEIRERVIIIGNRAWRERLIMNINFDDYESRNYFDQQLRKCGLFTRLEEMGIQDGDTVDIYDFQFEYQR